MCTPEALTPPSRGSKNARPPKLNLNGGVFPDDDGEEFQDFPTCGDHTIIGKKGLAWAHGEVQFEETNLHSKYLIVPEGIKDAHDVLAVMCSLWGLTIPELFLAFDGGQDTASCMLDNVLDQDVWLGNQLDGGRAAVANFSDSLVKSAKGIATACSESKAWVYGFDGSYGSVDGDPMWGTCFNTAWSYFGQGRRSSSTCQRVEFICAKALRGLFGERKFRRHAVILSRNVETVVHYPSVSHRLQKDGKTVPDCVAAQSGKMNRPERFQMIWPEFTHIILYDGDANKYPFPDLYKTMRSLTSTVRVVIGGVHPALTNAVVDESENVPVVLLKHTGGAADVIAKALEQRHTKNDRGVEVLYRQSADEFFDEQEEWRKMKWSAKHPKPTRWSLPAAVKESNFVVVDVKKDGPVNVVDKILRVLSYTDDVETRQLGAASLEHDRLQEAWKSVVSYKYNAGMFGLSNGLYTYAIMLLALCTVVCAVLKVQLSRLHERTLMNGGAGPQGSVLRKLPELDAGAVSPDGGLASQLPTLGHTVLDWFLSDLTLQITVIVLPLLSGFLLSCISRFSPYHKWSQLTNAANMIKSEIYRYRTRVGEYARRQGQTLDVNERIRRMPMVRRELLCRRSAQLGAAISSQATSGANTPTRDMQNGAYTGHDTPNNQLFRDPVRIDFSKIDFSKEPLLKSERQTPRSGRRTPMNIRSKVHKTRRGAFQLRMEQIHTELGNGDVRLSSLAEPPRRAVRNERLTLVGAHDQDLTALRHFGEDFHPKNLQDKVMGSNADDGFSTLVADDYVRFRVFPAIADLSRLSRVHGRAIFFLETLRYLATMICAMVAVVKVYMLIPIVVAVIGFITHILDFHQFAVRLQTVNTGLTDLRNLVIWWESLDMGEQRAKYVLDHLVDATEAAIHADFLVNKRRPQKPVKEAKSEAEDSKSRMEEPESDSE